MLHNLETYISRVSDLVLKIHGIIYRNKFIRVLLEVFKSQHLSPSIFASIQKNFRTRKEKKKKRNEEQR